MLKVLKVPVYYAEPWAGRTSMTPLGIIRQAQADTLIDEDGNVVTLELLPGLSPAELRDFAGGCRVPFRRRSRSCSARVVASTEPSIR